MSAPAAPPVRAAGSPLARTVLAFAAAGALSLAFADIEVATRDPWGELGRLALAMFRPDFGATDELAMALARTVAFAVLGVALANVAGFALAFAFARSAAVRVFCATIRAVHELFWALIFLQLFGLSPLTGILAIAVPYAGIIAKVYAEILEEADPRPMQAAPAGAGALSLFLYVRLPGVWQHFRTYALYRLECGLRSSAVLGFLGLPTLGFHLETAFAQGNYPEAWALLFVFYLVIAGVRVWMRLWLLPFWLLAAAWVLPWHLAAGGVGVVRFLTHDVVPYPLRAADGAEAMAGLWHWLADLAVDQALPGIVATVQLTLIALFAAGVLAFALFWLVSPLFLGRFGRGLGHLGLVVLRSTPEYMLAYVALLMLGPSMLPAILALALHNGAIVGHLVGRFTETLHLRPGAATGVDRYAWEVVPRVYRQALAFLFYRWEVIQRESAILGFLGVATLGFYVDSAFAELRFDRAMALIAVTALLNIAVDLISRRIRARLRLATSLGPG